MFHFGFSMILILRELMDSFHLVISAFHFQARQQYSKILAIRFNPNIVEINSVNNLKLEQNNSNSLVIPSEHKSKKYDIETIDKVFKFPCSVDSNSTLICQKQNISASGLFDIYFMNFKILSNDNLLTDMSQSLLIYSNSTSLTFRKQLNC
jgi:hypothetical protein